MLKNKFLNIMFLSFVIALSLYSKPITLQSGWNLLGTGQDLTLSDINKSCIGIVWTYKSGQWSAFSPKNELQNKIDANSNISSLTAITANSGFWVEASSTCNTVTITPTNKALVANAGADQNTTTGSTVTLDGNASSDVQGNTLTYKWTITSKPEGSTTTLSDATAAKPTFTADVDGNYVFSLVVNDGTVDSSPDTVTVTASNNTGSGQWTLVNTIIYTDPHINDHKCYETYLTLSDGNFSAGESVSTSVCNWNKNESITFTGSWSPLPAVLIPGNSYPISVNISRSNPVTQWFPDDYISISMDDYDLGCGAATASERYITTGWIKLGSGDTDPNTNSWSGTFLAPDFGYAGSSDSLQFQIEASMRSGCVRYIYKWNK